MMICEAGQWPRQPGKMEAVTEGLQVRPLASALWDSFNLQFWTSNRPVKDHITQAQFEQVSRYSISQDYIHAASLI